MRVEHEDKTDTFEMRIANIEIYFEHLVENRHASITTECYFELNSLNSFVSTG